MASEAITVRTAIQCVDPRSGKVGDWLYSGDNHLDVGNIHSPLFHNIIKLCDWARANGWKPVGDTYVKGEAEPLPTVRRKIGRWD